MFLKLCGVLTMSGNGDEFEEVYSGDGRQSLLESDSLTEEEDAFMQGYDEVSDIKEEENEDKLYDEAFKKKARRSKRKDHMFDEEELEADVLMH